MEKQQSKELKATDKKNQKLLKKSNLNKLKRSELINLLLEKDEKLNTINETKINEKLKVKEDMLPDYCKQIKDKFNISIGQLLTN